MIDLRPAKEDILAYAGDTLPIRVTVADPDGLLVGATWAAQVRKKRADTEAAATFVVEVESDTVVTLTLSSEDTQALAGFKGEWDCQVSYNGTKRTVAQGAITIDYDVTR